MLYKKGFPQCHEKRSFHIAVNESIFAGKRGQNKLRQFFFPISYVREPGTLYIYAHNREKTVPRSRPKELDLGALDVEPCSEISGAHRRPRMFVPSLTECSGTSKHFLDHLTPPHVIDILYSMSTPFLSHGSGQFLPRSGHDPRRALEARRQQDVMKRYCGLSTILSELSRVTSSNLNSVKLGYNIFCHYLG